jgi:antitoxin YefM
LASSFTISAGSRPSRADNTSKGTMGVYGSIFAISGRIHSVGFTLIVLPHQFMLELYKMLYKVVRNMEALNISEARKRLFELRQRVIEDHDQVIMTHKQGNVVLISMDEWEAYQETVRLLNDRAALQALVNSFAVHDAGETVGKSITDVFADLS